jgi:CubicO group peptidase (beta-lactamase class C family)
MIRSILFAAASISVLAALATPLAAQSTSQEEIDARYDRALAAGYKALFLCSAIANAERNGATRTPESVMEWELTGIQAPLDQIVGELPHRIVRYGNGEGSVDRVAVSWSDDMPARLAVHRHGEGCSLAPIGTRADDLSDFNRRGHAASKQLPFTFVDDTAAFRDDGLLDGAFGGQYGEGTRTTAIFIAKDKSKLAERYAEGFGPRVPQRTWSVAKSLAAAIIVSHLPNGLYEPVQLDEWQSPGDPRQRITIDNLLRMASGRHSDTAGNRTDPIYWGGSGVMERAANWPLIAEPGTVYRYANNDTLMAFKAFMRVRRQHDTPLHFFEDRAMHHTVAEQDWYGDYVISSQVWSTAPDLARFGRSLLEDPVGPPFRGREYFAAASGPQPEGRSWGYGAGFWLFDEHEGIPSDTFFAAGNRGQYVVIVPSHDIVIVRRGEDPAGTRFDIEAFTRDVLAALGE